MYTNTETQTLLKEAGFPRLIPAFVQASQDKDVDPETFNYGIVKMLGYFFQNRIEGVYEKNIEKVGLPYVGVTIDDFQWDKYNDIKWYKLEHVRAGGWVKKRNAVLLYGDSDAQLTKLGCAISIELLLQGYSLNCMSLKAATSTLITAHNEGLLKKAIQSLKRNDFLYIYDFEPSELTPLECYLLASLLKGSQGKLALLLSSSTTPIDWSGQLDDVGLVESIEHVIEPDLIGFQFNRCKNTEVTDEKAY